MDRHISKSRTRVILWRSIVFKRFHGSNASRRFNSEILTRSELTKKGFRTIPIHFALDTFRILVLPRVAQSAQPINEEYIWEIAVHAEKMAHTMQEVNGNDLYSWLDIPQKRKTFITFKHFVANELERYVRRYGTAFLGNAGELIKKAISGCPESTRRTLCLNDLSPKNIIRQHGVLTHFDLENSLIGPPDYMLTQTAVNLVRDCGRVALDASKWLLERCDSRETVTAAMAFVVTRMLLYSHLYSHHAVDPSPILDSLTALDAVEAFLEQLSSRRHTNA